VFLHITHSFHNKKIEEHTHTDNAFFLSNKKGNYLALGRSNFSHTQGLFFFDKKKWEMYKTIEDIKLADSKGMAALKNNFFNVQRTHACGAQETFNLFNNSLIYSLKNYTGRIDFELDFRHMFDYHDQGRIYTITQEDGFIIIRYDKYADNSLSYLDRTVYLAIKICSGLSESEQTESEQSQEAEDSSQDFSNDFFNEKAEWVKKSYVYDAGRGSKSEFYIYKAFSLQVRKSLDLVISYSDDKEEAKKHAAMVAENRDYLLGSLRKYVLHTFNRKDLYLNTAMKALDDLVVSVDAGGRSVGVFAGLPWFYQFWARDELICLKALMLQEKYYLVKSILFKYLSAIAGDCLVPNRIPSSDISSIDATGWLFLRIKEYIKTLSSKKILNDYLSVSDIITIKRSLERAIQNLAHNHSDNDLIINQDQESWMDTLPARRSGACIEVQALFLSMINLHNQIAGLTKSKQLFKSLEKEVLQRVRHEFFIDGKLKDSVSDAQSSQTSFGPDTRPNIFLAYYIYPGLLSKKDWKLAFDHALNELWLGWGGLASLNPRNHLFRPEYTGADDQSYHNGDSWYYVNNYAAIAMHRLDKKAYSAKIKRILHASKEEMMFSGFIGCCAEVSSAKHMQSKGCLSQAWSAASLIELMHEIYK